MKQPTITGLKYDLEIDIATAHSRMAKTWRNKKWRWSDLLERCREPRRSGETIEEYLRMKREEQSVIKDVGGFVGGYLANGIRKTNSVLYRSLVTLDIDEGDPDMWEDFTLNFACAAMMYTTHKHTPQKPRYRVVLPANRNMTPREYEPVCRYWAKKIGIERVDPASYHIAQLFYWPGASSNGEYVFEYQDGKPFDVDEVLATYINPADVSEWPLSSREGEVMAREIKKAGDPMEKPGLIGAFCRAYSIEDAIETFLPEVYEKTASEGRYTYRKGSVAGGCVTYEGKFAYSHHNTDPANGKLCNAFDIVRLGLFAHEDEGCRITETTRLPSFKKMQELVAADKSVSLLLFKERQAKANIDFSGIDLQEEDTPQGDKDKWTEELEKDAKGAYRATHKNLRLIMLNDPFFKKVKFDLFSQRDSITCSPHPFMGTHAEDEVDDTSLARMCSHLSDLYGIELSINTLVDKMLKPTAPERSYHAVKDFIMREQWDGVPRVDTLLTDYLGADDTPLTRAMMRKWMAGAVGRAIDIDQETGEGIKFDYCLVLFGEQGTGKSTFAETLAGRWRGSISFDDAKKEQYETLQRSWIVEIPEFKGMRAADTDAVKDLITSRSDNFRAAYARQWNKNPRHSILIGSTNNEYFLKDTSGNRRFWVVKVTGGDGVANWRDRLRENTAQIWAEAYHIYKEGECLMLPPELDSLAREQAEDYNEVNGDPLRDYLEQWLDRLLPVDWGSYEPKRQADYFRYYDPMEPEGVVRRDSVAICEILTTCPYPGISKYSSQRIGAILKSLGWELSPRLKRIPGYRDKNGKNRPSRFYIRPPEQPDESPL